jgi:protein TonB
MREKEERFHPDSPVQRDRTSLIPVTVAGIVLLLLAWQVRQSWIDALAPPYSEPAERAATSERSGGQVSSNAESARGNLAGLFTAEDYPEDAISNNEQGTVAVTLQIDSGGDVSGCTVEQSSGSETLDRATCSILTERARFAPARDLAGNAVPDRYTQRVVWRLQ